MFFGPPHIALLEHITVSALESLSSAACFTFTVTSRHSSDAACTMIPYDTVCAVLLHSKLDNYSCVRYLDIIINN